jgi:3-oxoacyl-[acyl-carrier protein] reductase
VARSINELEDTAAVIRRSGGDALVIPADVGDPDAVARAAHRIMDEGAADVLINNAAVVWPLGASVALDPAEWSAALAINVTGAVHLALALLPGMLERGWGRIVNVSSGIAARPDAMIGGNAYATSKAALEAHTVNLAAELAETGVTVNAYRPGTVDTEMQAWIRRQPGEQIGIALRDRFVDSYERGQLITPEESARSLVSCLLTGETGQIWSVTGS